MQKSDQKAKASEHKLAKERRQSTSILEEFRKEDRVHPAAEQESLAATMNSSNGRSNVLTSEQVQERQRIMSELIKLGIDFEEAQIFGDEMVQNNGNMEENMEEKMEVAPVQRLNRRQRLVRFLRTTGRKMRNAFSRRRREAGGGRRRGTRRGVKKRGVKRRGSKRRRGTRRRAKKRRGTRCRAERRRGTRRR